MKDTPAIAPANQALGIEGGYDCDYVEGTGHLLQVEQPDACARLTRELLAKHGFPADSLTIDRPRVPAGVICTAHSVATAFSTGTE